jgi:hypothetical protein
MLKIYIFIQLKKRLLPQDGRWPPDAAFMRTTINPRRLFFFDRDRFAPMHLDGRGVPRLGGPDECRQLGR